MLEFIFNIICLPLDLVIHLFGNLFDGLLDLAVLALLGIYFLPALIARLPEILILKNLREINAKMDKK